MATQVHDKFFKVMFARDRNVSDLLRSVLPAALVKHLDFDEITDARESLVRTSSIDGQVEQRFSDLFFRVPARRGHASLSILLEHKSRPEALTTFQSTRYMFDAWSAYLADHKNAVTLPDILPVIVHHGAGGWTRSTDLADDFDDVPAPSAAEPPAFPDEALDAIRPYRVRSRFILYDVATESDDQLRQRGMNPEATLALWVMVHAPGNKDITGDLPAVHDLMAAVRDEPHGHADLAAIVGYILEASETSREALRLHLKAYLGPKAERAYMTGAEEIRQEERERQELLRQEERQRQEQRFQEIQEERERQEQRFQKIQEEHERLLQAVRKNLYAALEDRGLSVADLMRARIDGCDDATRLTEWLRRAATAESAADILE